MYPPLLNPDAVRMVPPYAPAFARCTTQNLGIVCTCSSTGTDATTSAESTILPFRHRYRPAGAVFWRARTVPTLV